MWCQVNFNIPIANSADIRGNATALCDTTGSLTYDLSWAVTSESQCSAWYLVFGRWSILDIDIDCCLLNADAYDLASSINILC